MTDANDLLKLASVYENRCVQDLVKIAKIRKLPNGRYRVLSQDGKNLGTCKSEKAAKKRLKQVEYFKHFDHSNAEDTSSIIDLTDIDEFAYSAVMRKLRQHAKPEQVIQFLKLYKLEFDKAVKGKIHKPEKVALQNSMVKFNKLHKVKLDKKMVKLAAVAELGNADQVGKYLSDIVKFTVQRIPPEKRQHAIDSLKQKFTVLSEGEIASKQLPESSALGQSITFVKHVLFNHDAKYVREVLNSLVRSL
jgi:hypothetical protein